MLTFLQANNDALMHVIRRAHMRATTGFVSVSEPTTDEPAEPITADTSTAVGAME